MLPRTRVVSAVRELLIVAALYVAYSGARTLADGNLPSALGHASRLEQLERALHVPGEAWLNQLATIHVWLGLSADYWYATAHYVVTAVALVWLYRAGPAVYVPARRALALATAVALACYLALPTAPPRMLPGFTDVMALHADAGWWGQDASAPRGLGGFTNELAAFPSMHAGWALWVALAVWSATRSPALRAAGVAYALGTAVVVVATGNHWVLDVLVGQALVLVAWVAVTAPARVVTRLAPVRQLADRASGGEVEAA